MHTVDIGQCLCCFLAGFPECRAPLFRLPWVVPQNLLLIPSVFCSRSSDSSLLLLSSTSYFCCFRNPSDLQSSSLFWAGRRLHSSEPENWLTSMRHALPFIRFQGSPGSPGSIGLILGPYHGATTPEILHPFPSIWTDYFTRMND